MTFDPRSTPCNGRVAAEELRGKVAADRYVAGTWMRVILPVAEILSRKSDDRIERQVLYGDGFRVLDQDGSYAFGQTDRGGYVGWVYAKALDAWRAPTHIVTARASLMFAAPDIKSAMPEPVSLGVRVTVVGSTGALSETADGVFIPTSHLRPIADPETDPVAVAERLIGTPYLWGGNGSEGLDCSGLVQAALLACGIPCPGDSDQQCAAFPAVDQPRRGDLIFWQGHVALCVDADTLIHANAQHMAVTVEPRTDVVARIKAAEGKDVLKIARPQKEPL